MKPLVYAVVFTLAVIAIAGLVTHFWGRWRGRRIARKLMRR